MTIASGLVFLIVVNFVALFWVTSPERRVNRVVGATAVFLAVRDPISLVVMVAFAVVTHVITKGPRPSGLRTVLAVLPIAVLLIVYKVASAASGDDLLNATIIPLGLSYYALRCIHYSIERYRGNIRDVPPKDLVGYLFFLPTLMVGPIHRFPEWKRSVRNHRWDFSLFLEGIERLIYGHIKVLFLANFLVTVKLQPWIETSIAADSGPLIYAEMIAIGLNLYLLFSGYSDIAIGLGMLLGYRVMENFNWPFLKRNISDFWASWHISLTSWVREYVYTSAIAFTRNPAVGATASLLVIALWHEVSLRYLVWGIYHALGIVTWQMFNRYRRSRPALTNAIALRASHVGSVALTVHFVLLGFYMVRQPDLGAFAEQMGNFFSGWSSPGTETVTSVIGENS